jgi:hypothetical protein
LNKFQGIGGYSMFLPYDKPKAPLPDVAWDKVTHPTTAREDNARALHTQWGADPRPLPPEIREIEQAAEKTLAYLMAIREWADALPAPKPKIGYVDPIANPAGTMFDKLIALPEPKIDSMIMGCRCAACQLHKNKKAWEFAKPE